jgi:hypothetical protein
MQQGTVNAPLRPTAAGWPAEMLAAKLTQTTAHSDAYGAQGHCALNARKLPHSWGTAGISR